MDSEHEITPTRVTLRCLREDLTEGWSDVGDRRTVHGPTEGFSKPVYEFNHPAIRKAVGDYPVGQVGRIERESISGLTNPPFWKLKTDRWRGAVYVDPDSHQPWLVAAGLRRGGEASDFYAAFMDQVARLGAGHFLPSKEDTQVLEQEVDRAVQSDERAVRLERLEQAEKDACLKFLRAVRDALANLEHPVSFDLLLPGVSNEDPAHQYGEVEVLVVLDDANDPEGAVSVLADVALTDWERLPLIQWITCMMAARLERDESRWGITTSSPEGTLVQTLSVDFATSTELRLACDRATQDEQSSFFVPGGYVHTVRKSPLVASMVEGNAIEAVCGRWFVPRQDHHSLPRCPECEGIAAALNISAS